MQASVWERDRAAEHCGASPNRVARPTMWDARDNTRWWEECESERHRTLGFFGRRVGVWAKPPAIVGFGLVAFLPIGAFLSRRKSDLSSVLIGEGCCVIRHGTD